MWGKAADEISNQIWLRRMKQAPSWGCLTMQDDLLLFVRQDTLKMGESFRFVYCLSKEARDEMVINRIIT